MGNWTKPWTDSWTLNWTTSFLAKKTNIPSDMIRWYDGQDPTNNGVIPPSGAAIPTWKDKSSSGVNATQGTGADQPVYAFGINGHGDVNFVSNDFLSMAASVSLAGGFTMFIVNNTDTTNATRIILGTGAAGTNNKIGITNPNLLLIRIIAAGSADTSMTYAAGNSILTIQRDAANKVDAAFNGAAFSRLFSNAAQSGTSVFTTIGIDDTTNSGDWNGDLGEIIIYNRTLTSEERRQVETYLSQRWDIALS